jgi:hypothetical protein
VPYSFVEMKKGPTGGRVGKTEKQGATNPWKRNEGIKRN